MRIKRLQQKEDLEIETRELRDVLERVARENEIFKERAGRSTKKILLATKISEICCGG